MFSVFRYSKLLLAKETAAHHIIIQTKQLFLTPISENTHYLSTLINGKDSSFTFNYLINSCGFSPDRAKSASTKVKLENSQKPDSVIELLKKYGFEKTQISVLLHRCPCLLSYDLKKTLLPKLDFFKSIGVSDIGRVLSSDPNLLLSSLKSRILPCYNVLKSVVGCNDKILNICERSSWVVYSRNTVPNVTLLREFEVPSSSIVLLLNHFPVSVIQNQELFRVAVYKVKEMGFDPLKSSFVQAVRVLSGKGYKSIWDRCSEKYKKWGWSEKDILSAFKKHPSCMIVSEKKIERTMCVLVGKFGFEPKMFASFPAVFNFSLEKRIIPRCSVVQVLASKGLVENISLRTVLLPSDKLFLERFVTRYEDELPQLLKVYQGGC